MSVDYDDSYFDTHPTAFYDHEMFYAALGHFVQSWADMEFYLDLLVAHLFVYHGARNNEKRLLRGIEAKVRYLRKAARWNGLRKHTKRLLKLARDVETSAEQRHNMVHGFKRRFTLPRLEVLKIDYKSDPIRVIKYKTTEKKLEDARWKANRMAAAAIGLMLKVDEILKSKKLSAAQIEREVRLCLPILESLE